MRTKFDKETYGQRWQVETVMSMIKRNQGDCLRSRTYWAQNREMMLKVLTHNIGIILFVKELFYRAGQTPFSFDNLIFSVIFALMSRQKRIAKGNVVYHVLNRGKLGTVTVFLSLFP